MALARNICIGFDPETEIVHTFSWGIAPDLNGDTKVLQCGYVPRTKGASISPMQETVFIGGSNLGYMYQTFKNDLAQDDGTDFDAVAIINNIDPTLQLEGQPDTKRFIRIDFTQDNPYDQGLTLEYCANINDPHETPATWTAFTHKTGSIRAFFNSVVARHVNIRIRKTTAVTPTQPVFSSFVLHFIRLFSRKGDQS
jgi:hypothetical protein